MNEDEQASLRAKIKRWSKSPERIVHKIIAIVLQAEETGGLPRRQVVERVRRASGSSNASGAVSSLLTSKGNSNGGVLIDQLGVIHLHPDVINDVRAYHWSI